MVRSHRFGRSCFSRPLHILCSVHLFVVPPISFFIPRAFRSSSTRPRVHPSPPAPSVAFIACAAPGHRHDELSTASFHPRPLWYVNRPTRVRRIHPDDVAPHPPVAIFLFDSLSICLYGVLVGKNGASGTQFMGPLVESRSRLTPSYRDSVRNRSPDHVFHFNLYHHHSVRLFCRRSRSQQPSHVKSLLVVSICNIQGTERNHSRYHTSLHLARSAL